MDDQQFVKRAERILRNMALEHKGWVSFFSRWFIAHEPLRRDAANLLRESGRANMSRPDGTHFVGDAEYKEHQDSWT